MLILVAGVFSTKKEANLLYRKIFSLGFAIGLGNSFLSPWGMVLAFFFPVVWILLGNKKEYWTLALGYYAGVSAENPWLIRNFLQHFEPQHPSCNGTGSLAGSDHLSASFFSR